MLNLRARRVTIVLGCVALLSTAFAPRAAYARACTVATDCPQPGFDCHLGPDGGAGECVGLACGSDADCAAAMRCDFPLDGCMTTADGGTSCSGWCAPQWEEPCVTAEDCGPGFSCSGSLSYFGSYACGAAPSPIPSVRHENDGSLLEVAAAGSSRRAADGAHRQCRWWRRLLSRPVHHLRSGDDSDVRSRFGLPADLDLPVLDMWMGGRYRERGRARIRRRVHQAMRRSECQSRGAGVRYYDAPAQSRRRAVDLARSPGGRRRLRIGPTEGIAGERELARRVPDWRGRDDAGLAPGRRWGIRMGVPSSSAQEPSAHTMSRPHGGHREVS